MPRYLPLHEIRFMTYEELERWWEVDFAVLASTAFAEATGTVHHTVTDALHSEDWLEQWADALYGAFGKLASTVERQEFTGHPKLELNQGYLDQVRDRLAYVRKLLKTQKQQQGLAMLPEHMTNAYKASLSILARHHEEEAQELGEAETERRGLPARSPYWGRGYADRYDAIEDAVRLGLLHAPVTEEVRDLLRQPLPQLIATVVQDVREQEERRTALRHPLAFRAWRNGLEHLRDRHCPLAGMEPLFTVHLPALDMAALRALDPHEANKIINRRRFIRSLGQRHTEHVLRVRETVRASSLRLEEVNRPWFDARAAAREELGRRYPDQLRALLRAFEPFCVPGTWDFGDARTRAVRQVIPLLKKALADDTWKNLL